MRLFHNRVLAVGQRKRSARKTPDVAKGENSFAGPDGAFRAERGALARACHEELPALAGRVVSPGWYEVEPTRTPVLLRRPLIALALLLAIPVAVSAQDEMPDDLCSVEGVVYVTSYLEQVLEVLRNGGDADNALLGAQILIASYRSDC